MCEIARVRHALCDIRAATTWSKAEVPGLRITTYGGTRRRDLLRLAAGARQPYAAVATAADDVALIAFTSGHDRPPQGLHALPPRCAGRSPTPSPGRCCSPEPDDVFAGSPPLGFTFGLGGLVIFPLRAGASALLLEQARPAQLLAAVAEHRVSRAVHRADRVPRDARRAGLDGVRHLRRCAAACRRARTCPPATWRAWHERTGLRIINGIGATELLHIFISAADDAIRPGHDGVPVPGWQARVRGRRGRARCPTASRGCWPYAARWAAGIWPIRASATYVRGGWNFTGDTYIRDGGRLLPLCGPRRRHDHLCRVQHRGPRGRGRAAAPSRCGGGGGGRAVPDAPRGQVVVAYVVLRRRARDAGPRRRCGSFVRSRAGAVQMPARDRLPGRAAAHRDRQAPAVPAARSSGSSDAAAPR